MNLHYRNFLYLEIILWTLMLVAYFMKFLMCLKCNYLIWFCREIKFTRLEVTPIINYVNSNSRELHRIIDIVDAINISKDPKNDNLGVKPNYMVNVKGIYKLVVELQYDATKEKESNKAKHKFLAHH
jgi:hypothetical protein